MYGALEFQRFLQRTTINKQSRCVNLNRNNYESVSKCIPSQVIWTRKDKPTAMQTAKVLQLIIFNNSSERSDPLVCKSSAGATWQDFTLWSLVIVVVNLSAIAVAETLVNNNRKNQQIQVLKKTDHLLYQQLAVLTEDWSS